LCVFAARLDGERIDDDRIGVDDGLNFDFLLENVVRRVFHAKAEIALAANDLVFPRFVARKIGVRILENVADEPFADRRDFLGARLVRKDANFRFVHEAVAD
jgi:hypothetical protein